MINHTFKFKTENPSDEIRKQSYEKLKNLYPDKIAIICEKYPESDIEELNSTKFLVPKQFTINDFIKMLQKKFKKPFDIDIIYNNQIINNLPLKEIFEKYKDPIDNFIYFFYKLKELNFNFKINNSLKDRIESYKQISKKYPNKIPIICEKYPKCNDIEELNKTKFLIEKTHKIKEFLILLEKNNKLSHPICLIINEKIIDENENLENLYNNFKDEEDNMLYCFYSKKMSNSENFNSDSQSNSFEIETNIDSVEPQYKNNFSLIERKSTFKGINEKYPNKIPIICEKHPKSKLNKIEKTRFLINNEMTLNEFKLLIEKYFFDKSEIYIFINDKFIHANLPMKELYNKYKDDDDNFLYCFYSETDDFSTFNNESFDDNKNSDEENNSYEYNEDD